MWRNDVPTFQLEASSFHASTRPTRRPNASVAPLVAQPPALRRDTTGATGGQPAPVNLQCAWCSEPRAHARTRLCECCDDEYRTRAYDLADEIGRGRLA